MVPTTSGNHFQAWSLDNFFIAPTRYCSAFLYPFQT